MSTQHFEKKLVVGSGPRPRICAAIARRFSIKGAPRRLTIQRLLALAIVSPTVALADPGNDKQAQLAAHGKYIVEHVGMCEDCHSPRDSHGNLVPGQSLRGAPIPGAPMPGWKTTSPKIAGLPAGYTEAQVATFLETGRTRTGGAASPPMPPYRMDSHDAQSVAAYLKTLK